LYHIISHAAEKLHITVVNATQHATVHVKLRTNTANKQQQKVQ